MPAADGETDFFVVQAPDRAWLPSPTLRDQMQRAERTLQEAAAMLARAKSLIKEKDK